MACCSNKCNYLHKTATVTTTDTNVVLTFSDASGVENQDHFCFAVLQDVPETGAALAVQVTVNGTPINLLDKYGNYILGNQLQRCKIYHGVYGSGGPAPHVLTISLPARQRVCCQYRGEF